MDADNPVLVRHLASGGRAVYLQNRMLVVAANGQRESLLDERAMPVSLDGLARYNVANAMAAAAALVVAQIDHDATVAGLRTFVSDGRTNPLRSNVFDVAGVKVVVDFAHNSAAYGAISQMAAGLTVGQSVGVVSAPGDRRDCDLRDIGKVCAAGFDRLVVYESENRGRNAGQTASLIMEGASESPLRPERLHCRVDVYEAIRFGLGLCTPGDVLVFGCGSSLNELIEAIRPAMAQLADRITTEVFA